MSNTLASVNSRIAQELEVRESQVAAAVDLLDGGATVPFIARYRKEVTGGLDDEQLRTLEERLRYLRELDERRAAILESIESQGKLTDALRASLMSAETKSRLEDIYLPYKTKRRTKAQIAREAGLAPDAPCYAICEKGAVWFPFSAVPAGELPEVNVDAPVPAWVRTDEAMAIPPRLRDAMWRIDEERGEGLMFHDRTKLCMVSLEKELDADDEAFLRARDAVADAIEDLLAEEGRDGDLDLAPSVISIDVEHTSSGKDLGLERCLGMMGEEGVAVPERWITMGDSRSDYAMADALHAMGVRVEHMDVRPEDGVPEKPYGVLTAADLAERGVGQAEDGHERAGESLLRWAERDLLA